MRVKLCLHVLKYEINKKKKNTYILNSVLGERTQQRIEKTSSHRLRDVKVYKYITKKFQESRSYMFLLVYTNSKKKL